MTWLINGSMALGVLGVIGTIGMLVLALGQEVIPAVLCFIADAAQPKASPAPAIHSSDPSDPRD